MRARLSQRLLERINSFRRMTENDMAKARGTDEFGSIDPVPRRGSPFLHQRDTSPSLRQFLLRPASPGVDRIWQ